MRISGKSGSPAAIGRFPNTNGILGEPISAKIGLGWNLSLMRWLEGQIYISSAAPSSPETTRDGFLKVRRRESERREVGFIIRKFPSNQAGGTSNGGQRRLWRERGSGGRVGLIECQASLM